MSFERAKEEQPRERAVIVVPAPDQAAEGDEGGPVVAGFGFVPESDGIVYFVGFVFDDGGVEILFGGEVLVDDGFGDADGGGEFAGGGAAESFVGEQPDGLFDDGLTAF